MDLRLLKKRFYERDPKIVARGLLGKKIVRRFGNISLEGLIIETEAYYGSKDPASRAFYGMKNYNKSMWGEPGSIFIYNVHNNWMFNIVAHEFRKVGAILIRALEPLKGIEVMKVNRGVGDLRLIASGPGRLSRALNIDKSLNNKTVTSDHSEIFIVDNNIEFDIGTSYRIGVKIDLDEKLRFFIKGNKYVSR